MNPFMLDWINNPHAGFVLASYAVAFGGLIGLGGAIFFAYRRTLRLWKDHPASKDEAA